MVHAHGLRAGLVAALARPAQPLVVTWHNAVLASGLRGQASRLVERVVARAARVTLGASQDLVDGPARSAPPTPGSPRWPRRPPPRPAAPAPPCAPSSGIERDRPLILSVGRLHPQKRYDVLVDAAARWRALDPSPVVVIAGTGPAYLPLAARISAERAPVTAARAPHRRGRPARRPPTSPW